MFVGCYINRRLRGRTDLCQSDFVSFNPVAELVVVDDDDDNDDGCRSSKMGPAISADDIIHQRQLTHWRQRLPVCPSIVSSLITSPPVLQEDAIINDPLLLRVDYGRFGMM